MVPWADLRPNPNLIEFWSRHPIRTSGKSALNIGCGLGDDAEAARGVGIRNNRIRHFRVRYSGVQPKVPRPRQVYRSRYFESTASMDRLLRVRIRELHPASPAPYSPAQALQNAAKLVKEGGHLTADCQRPGAKASRRGKCPGR